MHVGRPGEAGRHSLGTRAGFVRYDESWSVVALGGLRH